MKVQGELQDKLLEDYFPWLRPVRDSSTFTNITAEYLLVQIVDLVSWQSIQSD